MKCHIMQKKSKRASKEVREEVSKEVRKFMMLSLVEGPERALETLKKLRQEENK